MIKLFKLIIIEIEYLLYNYQSDNGLLGFMLKVSVGKCREESVK